MHSLGFRNLGLSPHTLMSHKGPRVPSEHCGKGCSTYLSDPAALRSDLTTEAASWASGPPAFMRAICSRMRCCRSSASRLRRCPVTSSAHIRQTQLLRVGGEHADGCPSPKL